MTLLIITRSLRPDSCAAARRIIQLETGIKIVAAIFTTCFAIYPLVTLNIPVIGLLCKSVEGNSAANRMAGIGPE